MLQALPPEIILMRWRNWHLAKEGSARRVTDYASSFKDGEVYDILLHSMVSTIQLLVPVRVLRQSVRVRSYFQMAHIRTRGYIMKF